MEDNNIDKYEEAIIAAIKYGLEGEAVMGVDSLIDKFPNLYEEAANGD